MCTCIYMVVELTKQKIKLTDNIIGFMKKTVTPYGNGAKVDCQKKYLGKTVYLVICDEKTKKH